MAAWANNLTHEARSRALGAQYLATRRLPSPASFAASTSSEQCSAALVMLENRDLLANVSHYASKAVALNYLYAQRHGHEFVLLLPAQCTRKATYFSWCKISALQLVVERRAAAGQCTWLMFLDSDAIVSERYASVAVPRAVSSLLPPMYSSDAQFVFAREERYATMGFTTEFAVNTMTNFELVTHSCDE